ncbi:P1 family peptidase [Parvularcula dongshanensis]|uniref:L-aminopeptidase/D-esterase-like protein n=1 Tax=Parvularcula dongshanensis TaxID=1173995 RepID=A0A840I4V4_9PROT|nr:P1 family peptidase [Parvularcula dongshanensis]MBB4659234.1 L-aminopeptidase/D-esterase-like protein [Parvularcula dongshanensis]
MPTGPTNSLADIGGLRVGCAQDEHVRTGVTVIVPERPAICAVDVRGGGPGTRETDAMRLEGLVYRADAIVLSGGSVYGLAAADAVTAMLGAAGRGFSLVSRPGVPVSPIVPAAILYDLANSGAKDWRGEPPYARLGREAFAHIGPDVALGRAGAGYGARAGAHPGGQGTASSCVDGITVAAIAAVNSFGSPYVPGTKRFWAAPWEADTEFGGRGVAPAAGHEGLPPDTKLAGPRENTTLAVVATDAALDKAQAKRLAIMAQDGLARAIRPAHGPTDGDVVFVLSTGEGPPVSLESLLVLGTLGADVLARAVARGVFAAEVGDP